VSAFDVQRPPSRADLDTCVHCGFCLPTCPTYLLWGEEMDSPRGRIVLMDAALREADAISPAMATHWDRCLGCMACVTACPSGVRYDRLIEATRPQVERNYPRTWRERARRRMLFAAFTRPGRLRPLVPLAAVGSRLGARRLGRALPDRSLAGAVLRLTPRGGSLRRLPTVTPSRGRSRGRVGFLQGCVQRVFFHGANRATVAVLAAEGFEVHAPRRPRCCGALMLHTGYEEEALGLARGLVEAFEPYETVVVNAAGCGSSMKDYGRLLADDAEWAERAAAFSAKVRDVSELLASVEPQARRSPLGLRVAYHDACHLAHAQGVRAEPRALLAGIPAVEVVDPAGWEVCCGSAGVYNLLQPSAAAELGRRKAEHLAETEPDVIAAGNPGCALQIATYLEEAGRPTPIVHPVELVARSLLTQPAALPMG
jgi:glycolate oxidase iron-sulfur subunit